jgi:hypothetical protein
MPSVLEIEFLFVIVYREFSLGLYLCLELATLFPVAMPLCESFVSSSSSNGECQSTGVAVLRLIAWFGSV